MAIKGQQKCHLRVRPFCKISERPLGGFFFIFTFFTGHIYISVICLGVLFCFVFLIQRYGLSTQIPIPPHSEQLEPRSQFLRDSLRALKNEANVQNGLRFCFSTFFEVLMKRRRRD